MSQPLASRHSGRSVPLNGEPVPLQQRILTGSQSSAQPATQAHRETVDFATQYAIIGLLDDTVVARLECRASLGQVTIGRGSLAGIQIHDPFVHRVHADIHWDPDIHSHVITHAGGSNGTFVNLQRIDKPTRLVDGARIRVGRTGLIYRRVYYPGS